MPAKSHPLDLWTAPWQMGLLIAETQAVVAMRLFGMAGLWNVTKSESTRMICEKPTALAKSAADAMASALRGERPDQVMVSGIRPLRAKTRSNTRRLAKRGPKLN